MFMLELTFTKPASDVEPQNKAHGEWVRRYLGEGTFLFAGVKKSGTGGVLAVKSIEREELNRIIAEDSYIKANVGGFGIVEFDTKLAVPEFESLKTL